MDFQHQTAVHPEAAHTHKQVRHLLSVDARRGSQEVVHPATQS
jgi:hypothetical protein